MIGLDRLIAEFDRALRAVGNVAEASRASPAEALPEAELNEHDRRHAAALMRVNHVGEVCAQALYQGQALTARDAHARHALERAAREEEDHLAWSARRVRELGGRTSLLNPFWYAGALCYRCRCGSARRSLEPRISRRNRAPGRRAPFRASRSAFLRGRADPHRRRGDAGRRGDVIATPPCAWEQPSCRGR